MCGSSVRWCGGGTAGGCRPPAKLGSGVAFYAPPLRPATEDAVFFVGDSAGHCFPLSGEGIGTALYFGIACGRELTAVFRQQRSRGEALERYAAFSAGHSRAFALAGHLQRIVPALPPWLLMSGLRLLGRQWLIDRSFGWYLDQAPPSYAAAEAR